MKSKGFTLIETLVSMACLVVVLTLITPFLKIIFLESSLKHQVNRMEWEIFLQQAKMEIRESTSVTIANNKLYFYQQNQVISYEKYGDKIRRRVNGSGHEIILQEINSVTFHPLQNGIEIRVVDIYDITKSAKVYAIATVGVTS
ncbi:prepilin-type N-terminal cleavage/methylation domain-containing protein [Bacillus timonensis]|nr:prepilin-type N-terminal cleavage/methylation domain-containing protein [Bacillus timonensis]